MPFCRKCESLIKSADVFNDVATLRQQLVILGTPKTVREWRFYAYENGGFVLMLPINRSPHSDAIRLVPTLTHFLDVRLSTHILMPGAVTIASLDFGFAASSRAC